MELNKSFKSDFTICIQFFFFRFLTPDSILPTSGFGDGSREGTFGSVVTDGYWSGGECQPAIFQAASNKTHGRFGERNGQTIRPYSQAVRKTDRQCDRNTVLS